MGLFDSIKDALTTDDAERYEAAAKNLEKAEAELAKTRQEVGTAADPRSRARVEKAEKDVADLRGKVDELAAKAGVNVPDPAADAAAAKAQADADAQAKADTEAVERMKEQQRQYAEEQAAAQAAPAEAAPVEAEPLVAETLREYTVVKGDTLSAIGKKFGVKWRDIAELNDVKNPDLIYPGQVFKIPNA